MSQLIKLQILNLQIFIRNAMMHTNNSNRIIHSSNLLSNPNFRYIYLIYKICI